MTSPVVEFPRDENGRSRVRRQRVRVEGLPHDVSVEDAVISLLVLDGAAMLARCAKEHVGAEAFYDPRRALMFRAVERVVSAGSEVDAMVLMTELRNAGEWEQVGDALFVQMTSALPTQAQAGFYLKKLRALALRRHLLLTVQAVAEDVRSFAGDEGEIDEWCSAQEQRILDFTRARMGVGRASGKSLPRLMPWGDLVGATRRPEPPQLVEGLIHRGGKVMLGGGSKSFKTWCLADLGLSVAMGVPWWGLRTTRGRVLYVNFELQPWSFEGRIRSICEKKGIALGGEDVPSFVSWHLRGYAADLRELIPQFLVQTVGSKFDMIILDPIYKCLGERDENANGEVAGLLNEVEALAVRSDAAVVFGHHFSKGNQAGKDARDRVSGAGAWVRDPDTVITLTPHEEEECFSAEFTLRDLKPRSPMVVRWSFPCMLADGKLDPSALRQPGAPNKWTAETVVDLLRKEKAFSVNSGLSYSKLEAIAKRKPTEMSESTFKRKLGEAKEMGRVECVGGVYFVEE